MTFTILSFSSHFGYRGNTSSVRMTRLFVKACIIVGILGLLGLGDVGSTIAGEQQGKPAKEKSKVFRLSLDDAVAMQPILQQRNEDLEHMRL